MQALQGNGSKILVVDDEPDALEVLGRSLRDAGFKPLFATDGAAAISAARNESPGLILLDVMLPQLDGLEVCRILRRDAATAEIPIVMVTARTDEVDRIVALELGADDYVTKPFSPRELILRMKKLLTRGSQPPEPPTQLTAGAVAIDFERHEVSVGGTPVVLTATEFRLLSTLARRQGCVQSRAQLLENVWEYEPGVSSRTVDTHMRRLREKLGIAAGQLETVRGVGYRFVRKG